MHRGLDGAPRSRAVMTAYILAIDQGTTGTTCLTVAGDGAILSRGYATVASDGLAWTRHVAELRVLVSPSMRGLQLGRILTEQAFAIARQRGVRKMIAQMTLDQRAAMRVFSHIGFEREARLRNQLIDRDGQLHDLQIMSLDVDEFRAKIDLMTISAQHEFV